MSAKVYLNSIERWALSIAITCCPVISKRKARHPSGLNLTPCISCLWTYFYPQDGRQKKVHMIAYIKRHPPLPQTQTPPFTIIKLLMFTSRRLRRNMQNYDKRREIHHENGLRCGSFRVGHPVPECCSNCGLVGVVLHGVPLECFVRLGL